LNQLGLLLYGSNYRAANDSELHTKRTPQYTLHLHLVARRSCFCSRPKTSLQVIRLGRRLHYTNTDLYSYTG